MEGYLQAGPRKSENFFDRLNGYSLVKSQSMPQLVADLNQYLKNSIFASLKNLVILTEPGRWLCTHCFHILLKVVDVKSKKLLIVDGGTENFGFASKETFYYPAFNLTSPGKKEKMAILAGSLCAIDDIWGYYFYGKDIKKGDVIMLPFQGSYTFSYSKNFIKPFPRVYNLDTE